MGILQMDHRSHRPLHFGGVVSVGRITDHQIKVPAIDKTDDSGADIIGAARSERIGAQRKSRKTAHRTLLLAIDQHDILIALDELALVIERKTVLRLLVQRAPAEWLADEQGGDVVDCGETAAHKNPPQLAEPSGERIAQFLRRARIHPLVLEHELIEKIPRTGIDKKRWTGNRAQPGTKLADPALFGIRGEAPAGIEAHRRHPGHARSGIRIGRIVITVGKNHVILEFDAVPENAGAEERTLDGLPCGGVMGKEKRSDLPRYDRTIGIIGLQIFGHGTEACMPAAVPALKVENRQNPAHPPGIEIVEIALRLFIHRRISGIAETGGLVEGEADHEIDIGGEF